MAIGKNQSLIKIKHCQIKSIEAAYELADGLDKIEKACGIKSVAIVLEDNFVCADIDFTEMKKSKNPIYRDIGEILDTAVF